MNPIPIYTAENLKPPAYHLRYTWAGWPSSGVFADSPGEEFWNSLRLRWEEDGLRLLESKWAPDSVQLTFSVKPNMSPVYFAARVKGRLQHELRQQGTPAHFSRKVGFRTIGDNNRTTVEAYIDKQVRKELLADERFKDSLAAFTCSCPEVDLGQPTETHSGRYWYDLHLVFVSNARCRLANISQFKVVFDGCFKVAAKKSYQISRLSVMPDHVHIALRGDIEQSPEKTALAFMNNLAYLQGQNAIWERSYYAGTFGEYGMGGVRQAQELAHLPGKPAGA